MRWPFRRATRLDGVVAVIGVCAILGAALPTAAAAGSSTTDSAIPVIRGHELPTGPLHITYAINNDGVIAGADSAIQAAVWDPSSGHGRSLGGLPGSISSIAMAIDEAGNTAGVSFGPAEGALPRAVRWPAATGIVDLGTLGGTWSWAAAMNDHGIVVGSASLAGDDTSHAFVWSARRGMRDLGVLPGATGSSAHAVNNAGVVVGHTYQVVDGPAGSEPFTRAFRWSAASGMVALPGLGRDPAEAWAVNDRGVVVGFSISARGFERLVRWDRSGRVVDLGPIGRSGSVRGLTERGVIAGTRTFGRDITAQAFLYVPGTGFRDLALPTGRMRGYFVDAINDHQRVVGSMSPDWGVTVPFRPFMWEAGRRSG